MNTWITSAAHMLLVCWVAEAHDDDGNPFDAGDNAARSGEDWMYTVDPADYPEERLMAHAWAGRLYQHLCEAVPRCGDLWLALERAEVDAEDHAHRSVMSSMGHGTDPPDTHHSSNFLLEHASPL